MPSRECWFKSLPGAGPCDGRLVKCHLIPQQQMKKAYRDGLVERVSFSSREHFADRIADLEAKGFEDVTARGQYMDDDGINYVRARSLRQLLDDPRCWVYGCGGPMGPSGHHGQFKPDGPRTIDRHLLPAALEEFAAELGLGWWLDRTYGPRSFDRGEDRHTVTVDGAAAHAGTMHRDPLTGLYL